MNKIAVVGNAAHTLILFRLDLIKDMISEGHIVYAFSPSYSEKQRTHIKNVGAIPLTYKIERTTLNPLGEISVIKDLKKKFQEHEIDTVLSYFIKPVIYASIAAKLAGVKNINSMIAGLGYTFTKDPHTGLEKKRLLLKVTLSGLFKVALMFNDKVFFQNPDDLEYFVKRRLVSSSKTVRVFGSGVHLDRYAFKEAPSEIITFITSGRLIKEKGFIEFTEAARKLKKKYDQVDFVILGGKDESASGLNDEILEKWENTDFIEWPGLVQNVNEWLCKSSVFVLASYYREGTPRSALEAMATGRAIITTDLPGCRETVQNGVNGFLVPPKDAGALSDAMEKFIKDPSLIQKMGAKSRKIAERYYDVHKVNSMMIKKMGLKHN